MSIYHHTCNVCIVDMLTSAVTHWSRTSGDSIGTPGTRLHFYRFSSNHRVIKLLQISSCVTWKLCQKQAGTESEVTHRSRVCSYALTLLISLPHWVQGCTFIAFRAARRLHVEDTDETNLRICFILLFYDYSFGRTFQLNCS